MRKLCLLFLALGIVALSAGTAPAYDHTKSPGGSEITWSPGYPTATTGVGFIPPVVTVRFVVSPKPPWTPHDVNYRFDCYSSNGGFNGSQTDAFTKDFSEPHQTAITQQGTTAYVVNIELNVSNNGPIETAYEVNSGALRIR